MIKRVIIAILLLVAALALSGCNLLDALAGNPLPDNSPAEDADQGEGFAGTPVTLAPTLESFADLGTPTPTVEGGPTPLPDPTQIDPGAAQEGEEAAEGETAEESDLNQREGAVMMVDALSGHVRGPFNLFDGDDPVDDIRPVLLALTQSQIAQIRALLTYGVGSDEGKD